ncbi:MAG: peroxidase [Planctomycetota bacterium]
MLDDEREDWLQRLARDWRTAKLGRGDHALCVFAEKLTRTPGAMEERDVAALRAVGFDDVAIHDAIQVVAYFNYINRVADAVHVELEPEMEPYPEDPGS